MPDIRDIDADYKAAYIAEHAALVAAGQDARAAAVAEVLQDRYDHNIAETAKRRVAATRKASAERADVEKPADNTAEPKPAHGKDKEVRRNG